MTAQIKASIACIGSGGTILPSRKQRKMLSHLLLIFGSSLPLPVPRHRQEKKSSPEVPVRPGTVPLAHVSMPYQISFLKAHRNAALPLPSGAGSNSAQAERQDGFPKIPALCCLPMFHSTVSLRWSFHPGVLPLTTSWPSSPPAAVRQNCHTLWGGAGAVAAPGRCRCRLQLPLTHRLHLL